MSVRKTDLIMIAVNIQAQDIESAEQNNGKEWWSMFLSENHLNIFEQPDPEKIYVIYDPYGDRFCLVGYVRAKALEEQGEIMEMQNVFSREFLSQLNDCETKIGAFLRKNSIQYQFGQFGIWVGGYYT